MLRVIEAGCTDDFGNKPFDGGALVVGVKYTLSVAPDLEVAGDAGFTSWVWEIETTMPPDEAVGLVSSDDETTAARGDDMMKVLMLVAKDAARQLGFASVMATQRALEAERRKVSTRPTSGELMASVQRNRQVARYSELAEFIDSVEHFLWFRRWLAGDLGED